MIAGHYTTALAVKAFRPSIPLWLLFVAVQFVDFLWAFFVMLGIEKARLTHGITESISLDLYHIPFSHSIVATIFWSCCFGLLYLARNKGALVNALLLAGSVASHWLLDFIVHLPDLPLMYGEPKFGLGLWNNLVISQVLEIGLFLSALALYLFKTKAISSLGHIMPVALIIFMGMTQVFPLSPFFPKDIMDLVVQALLVYLVFVGLALSMDRNRSAS